MTTSITTPKYGVTIIAIDANGVTVRGTKTPSQKLPWKDLRLSAQEEENPAHRAMFMEILEIADAVHSSRQAKAEARAEFLARRAKYGAGTTVIAAVRDVGGVGARAECYWLNSLDPTPRCADEGGDYHGGGDYPFFAAVIEAEERARRVTNKAWIGREGYTLEDYELAKRTLLENRSLADGRKLSN